MCWEHRHVFRRDGDVWRIVYDGKRLRLKDAKGLQYIARLLRHDGRELHAAESCRWRRGSPEHVRTVGDLADRACRRGRGASTAARLESGHAGPEYPCETRPEGATPRSTAGISPFIWGMSARDRSGSREDRKSTRLNSSH